LMPFCNGIQERFDLVRKECLASVDANVTLYQTELEVVIRDEKGIVL